MRESRRDTSFVPTVATPTLDQIFEVLSHRRRRYVLYYLRHVSDGVASIEDIATHVAQFECTSENADDHQASILTSLQHVHLPKLEEAGVVEYDERSEMVRYWQQPTLDEWVEHAEHKEL